MSGARASPTRLHRYRGSRSAVSVIHSYRSVWSRRNNRHQKRRCTRDTRSSDTPIATARRARITPRPRARWAAYPAAGKPVRTIMSWTSSPSTLVVAALALAVAAAAFSTSSSRQLQRAMTVRPIYAEVISSPFEPSLGDDDDADDADEELPLTLDNVEKVLDELRPYLM